jgi:hypothetical protein
MSAGGDPRVRAAVEALATMIHENAFVRAAIASALRRAGIMPTDDNRAAVLAALAEKLAAKGGRP